MAKTFISMHLEISTQCQQKPN